MIDGVEKVTGKAKYTADLAGAGGVVRPDIALAAAARPRLVGRHIRRPKRWRAWSQSAPAPTAAIPFGVLPISENEYPLAREKVRYRGDPVAAVAAIDEATAAAAIKLIRVEYEPLPAYFDVKKAMAPGAEPDPRGKAQQHPARGA